MTRGYGFTVEDINWSSPSELKPYEIAYKQELKEKDYLAWLSGHYMVSAVSVAVEHNLAGKKAKSRYIEKPLLQNTWEEISYEQKVNQALLSEQMWISNGINRGLPETKIS